MNRGRRVALVCGLGLVAGVIAHLARSERALPTRSRFFAVGLVLGELLALRLEDRGALPLSYAVLVVHRVVVRLARVRDRGARRGVGLDPVCGSPTAATRGGSTIFGVRMARRGGDVRRVSGRVAPRRPTRRGRAGAGRARRRRGRAARRRRDREQGLPPRRVVLGPRPARLAGDRVVGHVDGDRVPRRRRRRPASASGARCCSPPRCSRPGTRSSASTPRPARTARRSKRSRWRPSSAAWCRPVTPSASRRWRRRWAEQLGLPANDVRDLEMAALLHHLGQVTLDDPVDEHGVDPAEVTTRHGRDAARDPARSSRRARSSPARSTTRSAASRCRRCGSRASTTT